MPTQFQATACRSNKSDSRANRLRAKAHWHDLAFAGLGIAAYMLWRAYALFTAFEGSDGAMGALPHDNPMRRVLEIAIFIAVAVVPVVIYGILRLCARRRK